MKSRRYRKQLTGIAVALFTIILIGCICRLSYEHYERELIQKEEEQLLTMAQTIGKSLVHYIKQELDSIDLYFEIQEKRFNSIENGQESDISDIIFSLSERKPDLYEAACCLDDKGSILYQTGTLHVPENLPKDCKKAVISGKNMNEKHWYQMVIARSFENSGQSYTVLYALNMNEIYRQIVEPVRIGSGGYSIVKDTDLTIIMHHAMSQIGIDALYDRSILYPQLDLSDLENLIHMQETKAEGTSVIRSYKWDDVNLTPEKRIVAYTTIQLPGEQWIVNSTLPYQELDKPLQMMIIRLISFGGMFLLILLFLEYQVIRGIMGMKSQKKEIAYLKEINDGMELLLRKEEEIQHYQRVQSLGEMSSHIAHEFNNYLTPIMVYGELLEGDPEITEEQKEMVTEILNVAEQAAGLSRKLLDFSRQDTSIVLEPVNLTEEVKKACSVVRQLTPARVNFEMELSDQECRIIGRKGMMEHILMNLCNNAFHAMEKNVDKESRLKVSMRTELPEKEPEEFSGYVCIQVSDTGCGISEEAMSHIFEPFYTTKRSGKGTGLGLSVVQNIMTACKGVIRVESIVGVGTTFFLHFPLADKSEEQFKQTKQNSRIAGKAGIWIVDDDAGILKALEAESRHLGLSCVLYDHPAAALSRIQSGEDVCKVLLTDYDMPSMNGIEFAEIVRKLNPGIRIILMSGLDEAQFSWHLKNKIIDAFVSKQELSEKFSDLFSTSDEMPES